MRRLGLLVGLLLLVQPGAQAAAPRNPVSNRSFERTEKGAIAIWSDEIPGAAVASGPNHLASCLREAGYGVHLLTTDELADRAILSAANFDLLVLPYGEVYPATGADALRQFLRRGKRLITLGGPCFRKPLWPADGGWTETVAPSATSEPLRPVVEPSEALAAALTQGLNRTDQPARVSLGRDPDKNASLRLEVDDLQFYVYLRLPTQGTSGYNVLRFRAVGDADTKHLCIETNEADGSRWKAAVELSPEWRTYEIPTGEFVSYASKNRGDEGDYLRAEKVRHVAFGFPRSMVGAGRRSFEISEVVWLASDVAPDQVDRSTLLLSDSSVLIRAFGRELKNANRGGDITAFLGSEAYGNVDTLVAAPGQTVFPAGDARMAAAFVTLVDRMLGGASIVGVEPRFVADAAGVRMEVVATVANHGTTPRTLNLEASLREGDHGDVLVERQVAVELGGGTSKETVVLGADADRFDWKQFSVTYRLHVDGKTVDRMGTSVDVRATLLALCDRFVERQQARGDGRIHGFGFVDNRGVRALLAAYELFDRPEYLAAAIRWGEATLAQQREDGGYLMGYGYYPQGDECYVADGGEIACGVGRLIGYVPKEDRGRYFNSLEAYMAFRESFRCEGGGIGVGWCKSDYGVRPIERLDEITRILAPEKDIYTIGCTLTSAVMHARLTGDPKDNAAAAVNGLVDSKTVCEDYGCCVREDS